MKEKEEMKIAGYRPENLRDQGYASRVLACKHEDLGLIPRTHVRMPGVVACALNPTLDRKRQEDP